MAKLTMDKLVALCKNRGFVFPGSEIYGGLANTWDYGPLGVALKNNVKAAWWKKFVTESPYNVGVDCAILMNPTTWQASGHLGGFSDPLMDCKSCKTRHRADNLIEDYMKKKGIEENIAGWTDEQMENYIREKGILCPVCGKGDFTSIRKFNLMFKTFQGVTEDSASTIYLRPETAQGIFVNFKNVQRTTRKRVPFGIGQIGKSFRNEITPGNFIFRVREFEQMELEFFCKPGTDLEWFAYWRKFCHDWLLGLGIKEENLRLRDHDPEELCFYSKATTDFEFLFPFGWGELWGVADRTDYDLTQHINTSGKDLSYTRAFSRRRTHGAGASVQRLRRGRSGRRNPRRYALRSRNRARQGRRASSPETTRRKGGGNLFRPNEALPLRIRPVGFNRQALPSSGRNRHAFLRDRRLRHSRHDVAGESAC